MNKKCPNCNNEMTYGQATIHGTVVGFLFFGLSYQNLYFKSEGQKETKILNSGFSTTALRCEKCETVILTSSYTDPNEIFDEGDFTVQTRNIIIELITICSSKKLQDNFTSSNPNINLWESIILNWKENYKPEMKDFSDSFSLKELILLKNFDLEIDSCLKLFQESNYMNFELTSEWQTLTSKAEGIINELNIT